MDVFVPLREGTVTFCPSIKIGPGSGAGTGIGLNDEKCYKVECSPYIGVGVGVGVGSGVGVGVGLNS